MIQSMKVSFKTNMMTALSFKRYDRKTPSNFPETRANSELEMNQLMMKARKLKKLV